MRPKMAKKSPIGFLMNIADMIGTRRNSTKGSMSIGSARSHPARVVGKASPKVVFAAEPNPMTAPPSSMIQTQKISRELEAAGRLGLPPRFEAGRFGAGRLPFGIA